MLAAQSFYRVSGFIVLMVLSRKLGAGDIGAFFFAMAFAESFLAVSSFGMNPVMARRVASSPERAAEHIAPILAFRLVSGPAYIVVVSVAAALFTSASPRLILAATLISLFEDIYFSFGALFLALHKATYNVVIGVIVHTSYLALLLTGMSFAASLKVLVAVTLVRAMSLAVTGILTAHTRLFSLRIQWDAATVRAALPFVLITALYIVKDQIGTLLLGTIATYEAVAHYNLAWRLVASSYFVPTAVCAVFVPLLTAHGLTSENRRLMLRAASGVGAISVLAAIVASTLADPLARLMYGPLALEVAPLIRALAVVFPLGFMALFLSLVLQALYQERHVLRTLVLVTVANFAANWILVPRLGALGAVRAQIMSTCLQLLILGWRLQQLHEDDQPIEMPSYSTFPEGSPGGRA